VRRLDSADPAGRHGFPARISELAAQLERVLKPIAGPIEIALLQVDLGEQARRPRQVRRPGAAGNLE